MRMRKLITLAVLLCSVPSLASAAGGWKVISASFRPDANPWAKTQAWDGQIWSEGWGLSEMFWPRYFRAAGSLHVILRNDTGKDAALRLDTVDGAPIKDVLISETNPGSVIWRRILPENTAAGGWVECIVRLRSTPQRDLKLSFSAGTVGSFEVTVPKTPMPVRIESISFSPKTDRVYVYLRGLDGKMPRPGSVSVDLRDAGKSCRWFNGPAGSGLVLAQVELPKPWEWGTYHLLQVALQGGQTLACSVRAYDSYFPIGLFGTIDESRIKEAIDRNFNTYVIGRPVELLDQLGINYVVRWGVGEGRQRTPAQSGALFYNNVDEPDAGDFGAYKELPMGQRLGANAELAVLPRFWEHVRRDPHTPSMVLTDNTFKPLNYYVYGQTSDIFCTDPYVPLGGEQVDYIAHALQTARDACAPHPLIATLWCTWMNQPDAGPQKRPPTPDEERLMTFYAIGSGVRGVFYFADRDVATGEMLVSVVHDRPVWDEMGRINADVKALVPYLSLGCPVGLPTDDGKVWTSTLMCGPRHLVVVVINKGYHIGYNTQHGFSWKFPAEKVSVNVPLPPGCRGCHVSEVKNGKFVPAGGTSSGGQLKLKLDVVDTARAFVIELGS